MRKTALLAIAVGNCLALALLLTVAAPPASSKTPTLCRSHCTPAVFEGPRRSGLATHYGTSRYGDRRGDQYLGGHTSCGRTVTSTSMFVATLDPGRTGLVGCDQRVTLWYRGRKFHTTVQDCGRAPGRDVDAAPGLRRAMGFSGVVRITWTKGWH